MITEILLFAALAAGGEQPSVAVSGNLVLKLFKPEEATERLIAKTEELGGYFAERNDQMLRLKVPVQHFDALVAEAEALGVVLSRSRNAQDRSTQLEQLRTRLRSRREVLQKYMAVLEQASAETVVTVEHQITQIVQEIESMQGQLQMLEHQLALAMLTVSFQINVRQPPARDGKSSFAWLNTVNLQDLLEAFQ